MNKNTTESPSPYRHLEKKSTVELLDIINTEDRKVALCVQKEIPSILRLVDAIFEKMKQGGRLFYVGAGTSGRLGILDASECPPTFGVSDQKIIAFMAGGDTAFRKAVEFAEDDPNAAWAFLQTFNPTLQDSMIGIAASGTTPYVVGCVKAAQKKGMITGCITNNPHTPLAAHVRYPIVVATGPEVVSGSTRMKAGTAQKLVLNMISTTLMIKLGRVQDNRMVDMMLTNQKLQTRGIKILCETLDISEDEAEKLLKKYKSVRSVLSNENK